MSFMDSSASTSEQGRSNQINFDSTSISYSAICENDSELLMNSNKSMKFSKSTLNDGHDAKHMDLCYDYNKCFTNTYQYSENNYGYDGESSYGLNTTINQTFNTTESYTFNEEPHEQQNQMGKLIKKKKRIFNRDFHFLCSNYLND